MSDYVDLPVLRNVVIVALVAGVGLTTLFAFGARALDLADRLERVEQPGADGESGQRAASRRAAGQRALGGAAMAVIGAAVFAGLWAVLRK
jgi:hypothetical protein